jgi:hypothetical protein
MTGLKIKRESNKMFAKNKVSQSMIDAVNSVLGETKEETNSQQLLDEAAEKVATPTGMRVYGSNYGNSAKARRDQTKSAVDTVKGPKSKELSDIESEPTKKESVSKASKKLLKDDEIDETGFHKAAHGAKRSGQSHFEFQGKKYPVTAKSHAEAVAEDSDCVTKPQAKGIAKKEIGKHEKGMHGKSGEVAKHEKKLHKEDMSFPDRLRARLEENKANGPQEVFTDNNLGEEEMSDKQMKKREKIVMSMKKGEAGFKQRYGKNWKNVMYATATKQAMKEDSSDSWEGQMDEEVKKSDVPSFLRKKRGDTPLSMKDVKSAPKDSISHKDNLAKARNEDVEVVMDKNTHKITTDMLSGRTVGGKLNSFKNFKVNLVTSGEETIPIDVDKGTDTKEKQKITTNPGPVDIKLDDKLTTPPHEYFALNQNEEVRGELQHIRGKERKMRDQEVSEFKKKGSESGLLHSKEEVEIVDEKVIAGTPGWKEMPKDVKDKSGAVHTPMSRAKDLARQSFKKIQGDLSNKKSN